MWIEVARAPALLVENTLTEKLFLYFENNLLGYLQSIKKITKQINGYCGFINIR